MEYPLPDARAVVADLEAEGGLDSGEEVFFELVHPLMKRTLGTEAGEFAVALAHGNRPQTGYTLKAFHQIAPH